MSSGVLNRIAEMATSEGAIRTTAVARSLITLLPWSAHLPAEDFMSMIEELRAVALRGQERSDPSELEHILGEWQATAEAYQNRGLMEQLGRSDRTYIEWP